jgi:hypothetical protein
LIPRDVNNYPHELQGQVSEEGMMKQRLVRDHQLPMSPIGVKYLEGLENNANAPVDNLRAQAKQSEYTMNFQHKNAQETGKIAIYSK